MIDKTRQYAVYDFKPRPDIYFVDMTMTFPILENSIECQNVVVLRERFDRVKDLVKTDRWFEGGQDGDMFCGGILKQYKDYVVATLDGCAYSDHGFLRSMFVREDFRNHDLGTMLFRDFARSVHQAGFEKLTGEVVYNAPGELHKFYKKLGCNVFPCPGNDIFWAKSGAHKFGLRKLALNNDRTEELNSL